MLWDERKLQVLREKDEDEYQPDEEEIREYAEHIGL
jgi:protein tyrosine phosphatase (PTP) superfamily phosphohydrolase (DUF442 family)